MVSLPSLYSQPTVPLGLVGSSTCSQFDFSSSTGSQVSEPSCLAGSAASNGPPGAAYTGTAAALCTTLLRGACCGAGSFGAPGRLPNVVACGSLASSASVTGAGAGTASAAVVVAGAAV